MLVKFIVFIITTLFSVNSFSWGKTGHRVVAELSTHFLSEKAQKEVKGILGFESMSEASLWPDRIKSDPKLRTKYSHLHYISFEKKTNLEDKKLQSQKHIISALKDFEKVLGTKKSSKEDKRIALRFLIHLMGDLHQPLHVGYRSDKGGNSVNLKWFGEKTNLHRVWDEHLIDMEKLSYTEYVTKLLLQDKTKLKSYKSGNYLSWAKESRSYLSSLYSYKSGKYWEYEYSYKNLSLVDKRLSQAGIRLAYILNNVFK